MSKWIMTAMFATIADGLKPEVNMTAARYDGPGPFRRIVWTVGPPLGSNGTQTEHGPKGPQFWLNAFSVLWRCLLSFFVSVDLMCGVFRSACGCCMLVLCKFISALFFKCF